MNFSERLERGRAGDPSALEELFAPWRPLLRLQADASRASCGIRPQNRLL